MNGKSRMIFMVLAICMVGCSGTILDPQHHLDKWVESEKKNLPRDVDKNVKCVNVKPGEMEILYYYRVHGVPDQAAINQQAKFEQRILSDFTRNRSKYERAIDYEIKITHIYQNTQGNELFRFTVKPWEL